MAMKYFLSEHPLFYKDYEVLDIKAVHLLDQSDIEPLEKIASLADLFIFQPVSDNYKNMPKLSTNYLLPKLRRDCQVISSPTAYFTGYHPEITYLQDDYGSIKNTPFPYHDMNILRLYSEGKSIEEVVRHIERKDFYDLSFVQSNLYKTKDNLAKREKNLTIKLSDFIEKNYRNHKLFHSFNHPSYKVLGYLFAQIMQKAGFQEDHLFKFFKNQDILSRSSFLIYSSIPKILCLEFITEDVYKIGNKYYSRRKWWKSFLIFTILDLEMFLVSLKIRYQEHDF
ncbi:MAG: hypothetical protein HC824_06965 [Synechococcales cyanobacterium RM1_1_8]|nr:hypothetical protein [Synechococcales cyanobacterium RM1_1_8]